MGNITKKDLVEKISDKTGLTQVDTKIVVESLLEAVSKALQQGKNIEIRGFGRFKIKERRARSARNPRTNEHIEVQAGYKPVFEASKELRKRVNDMYWSKNPPQDDASKSLTRDSSNPAA
jgi:DNA-binding protein HU-beta/integration host factor subunit beta